MEPNLKLEPDLPIKDEDMDDLIDIKEEPLKFECQQDDKFKTEIFVEQFSCARKVTDSSDSEGSELENPAGTMEVAKQVSLDLLPHKSRIRYDNVFKSFKQWYKEVKAKVINEDLILAYMVNLSKTSKPSSLWSKYSMLRSTIVTYNKIDIKYPKVIAYVKEQNVGYRPKKFKILERSEIDKFLKTANDSDYLMFKVVAIIGIASACRREELCKLSIDNVAVKDDLLVIKKPDTQNTFVVSGETNIETYRKYIALRPANTKHRRLFLTYRGGKCTVQPVGLQTIGSIPKKIAKFLQLPNPEQYNGHSFRQTSAKAKKVAESYILDSTQNKIEIFNRSQAGTSKDVKESFGGFKAGAVTVTEQNNITTVKLSDTAPPFILQNCNVTINITTKN